jgi:hypothetical protein
MRARTVFFFFVDFIFQLNNYINNHNNFLLKFQWALCWFIIQARQLVITVCTHFAAVELYCGYSIGDFAIFFITVTLSGGDVT